MRINTNMAAMNAWRSMESNQKSLQSSLERLSSGNRINKAADDAAGLAVSEKLKAQMRGSAMATRNTQDAVSMVQTAEGGASKIQEMLQRMRELAVQAGSDTLQDGDRSQLQEEFNSLIQEIDRTAKGVEFNGNKLLDGSSNEASLTTKNAGVANVAANGVATALDSHVLTVASNPSNVVTIVDTTATLTLTAGVHYTVDAAGNVTGKGAYAGLSFTTTASASDTITLDTDKYKAFQVGANYGETIETSFANLTKDNMGISGLSITTRGTASTAISVLDNAVTYVSRERAKLGAMQNRLDNTISTLQTQSENITAAESRIFDVDMAAEMASFTRFQVLSQASMAMLAQANQLPQGVLQLLRQ